MNKPALQELVKAQGKGIIDLKDEYKIVVEDSKKENKDYQYSLIYSVVYDGKLVKITYSDIPTDNKDFLKRYTNLKSLEVSLDELNNIKVID